MTEEPSQISQSNQIQSETSPPQTSQPVDYAITAQTPAPANYPFGPSPDEFAAQPFAIEFDARRRAFLEFILKNPAPSNPKAPWYELARLAAGGTPHDGVLHAALDYIHARKDSADLALHSILRLLYQYSEHGRLNLDIAERSRQVLLDFKYWPDEPGQDSMCTWTEHHYILFASAGYLAGQLLPDQTFTNSGQTGAQKMEINRARLIRWLDLRYLTGFSEWLSNVYYDEDLTALVNLADFCKDNEIRRRAIALIDILLFEIAANSFAGVFGATHGKSYEHNQKWAAQESTTDTQKLLFGCGIFTANDNMSAIALALSTRYRMPRVLYEIANDQQRPEMLQRQRMGIRIEQAAWWGLSADDFENGMLLLNLETYLHPQTASMFVKMLDAFDWWENRFFEPFQQRRSTLKAMQSSGMLSLYARANQKDLAYTLRDEANIYTYRTPDYMLSAVQDYRPGECGAQQHVWQATFGPDAVCFTTHPARQRGTPPNYWTGSGTLPRVAQIKNVAIIIYRIMKSGGKSVQNELQYTHAWLPRDRFEEVVEQEGWIFARLGDGYLALLSEHPYEWRTMPGEDQRREVIVPGKNNIWLCELGRRAVDGDFHEFVQRILQAEVRYSGSKVSYRSPSQGHLQFGWNESLRQDGRVVPLRDYPRFASPYSQADFPPEQIDIHLDQHSLHLDWLNGERQASSLV